MYRVCGGGGEIDDSVDRSEISETAFQAGLCSWLHTGVYVSAYTLKSRWALNIINKYFVRHDS